MGFLTHLRSTRGVAFSTLSNYINALVSCCKYYFTTTPSDREQFVLTGLSRIRSQTQAQGAFLIPLLSSFLPCPRFHPALHFVFSLTRRICFLSSFFHPLLFSLLIITSPTAKQEAVQKDVSKRFISWKECQTVRNKAFAETEQDDPKQLQRLVLLQFYTITPPPRSGPVVFLWFLILSFSLSVSQLFHCAFAGIRHHAGQEKRPLCRGPPKQPQLPRIQAQERQVPPSRDPAVAEDAHGTPRRALLCSQEQRLCVSQLEKAAVYHISVDELCPVSFQSVWSARSSGWLLVEKRLCHLAQRLRVFFSMLFNSP